MEKKISFAVGGLQDRFGDERAIEIAAELGADGIDFDLDRYSASKENSIYTKSDEEITEYFTSLRRVAEKSGIFFAQTHGRLRGFTGDEKLDRELLADSRLDFLAAKALGAPFCVVHHPTTIYLGPDADPAYVRNLAFDMFTKMIAQAKEYGVVVATETFGDAPKFGCVDFFGDLNEFMMIYNRICAVGDNADWFKVCVDTGHSNKAMRFGNPKPADAVRLLGPNIVCLHLNDNDTLTDQHKIPLSGTIDWKDVLKALDEVGYKGVYNMEVNLKCFGRELVAECAGFAVKVMRNLLETYK